MNKFADFTAKSVVVILLSLIVFIWLIFDFAVKSLISRSVVVQSVFFICEFSSTFLHLVFVFNLMI